MFNRSALDNIRYGRLGASEEEVHEAARRAEAHDFILGMRDIKGRAGYAAHLGERGVKLSGGQRQRIALAKALPPASIRARARAREGARPRATSARSSLIPRRRR